MLTLYCRKLGKKKKRRKTPCPTQFKHTHAVPTLPPHPSLLMIFSPSSSPCLFCLLDVLAPSCNDKALAANISFVKIKSIHIILALSVTAG
jgi:hypothetical protein